MPLKTKSAPKEHLGLTTRQKMKKYRAFYIMFIPLFLCLILFSYLPMFGILYAFTDYTPFKPAQFVGLQNFQKLFSQAGFWKAFFNTLQISITKLVIDTLGSIVLALLLDELHFKWFKKISQTIIYIPHFMSWVVVASIFTMFLSPKNGLINGVITALGDDDTSHFVEAFPRQRKMVAAHLLYDRCLERHRLGHHHLHCGAFRRGYGAA